MLNSKTSKTPNFVAEVSTSGRSRVHVTIAAGCGVLEPGMVLGETETGKHVPAPATSADGSHVASAVLGLHVDATTEDVRTVATAHEAVLCREDLKFHSSVDDPAKVAAKVENLVAAGLIVR